MKTRNTKISLIVAETISRKIHIVRGHKIMLDNDLAMLYDVPTKRLNEQVRRNRKRFPKDFMFKLNNKESSLLRSQFATSNSTSGGRRYQPYAFTEQGIAMLSSVLNSERAIKMNIAIMRAFVQLRQILTTHKELADKLKSLETKYDGRYRVVFEALNKLIRPPEDPPRPIGFHVTR